MIIFMSPLNPKNVAANCQNDDVWFNDSKFWQRIWSAKFSKIQYVAANSKNYFFFKTKALPNPDILG